MITKNGYSKDPSIMPEGIVITFGKEMIDSKGGLLSFMREFTKTMSTDGWYWLHKCKNRPKVEIDHVYIIINNTLYGRVYFGGYQTGSETIVEGVGTFSWSRIISWPRIILAGPIERAPFKRKLRGFQGFRYSTHLF